MRIEAVRQASPLWRQVKRVRDQSFAKSLQFSLRFPNPGMQD